MSNIVTRRSNLERSRKVRIAQAIWGRFKPIDLVWVGGSAVAGLLFSYVLGAICHPDIARHIVTGSFGASYTLLKTGSKRKAIERFVLHFVGFFAIYYVTGFHGAFALIGFAAGCAAIGWYRLHHTLKNSSSW